MTIKNLLIIIHLDLLLPLAVFLNLYLYFYPTFHFCAFTPHPTAGAPAPFRLLALADPQLEGDTTLHKYKNPSVPETGTIWDYVHPKDPMLSIRGLGKLLDLWGNDLYLRHVFRSTRSMLAPTHTVVLGDLVGSQWISDEEFAARGERFWRIFGGREEGRVTHEDAKMYAGNVADAEQVWGKKVMVVPGNHDIGYAGDMDWDRVRRFEDMFGAVNYVLNFTPNISATAVAKIPPTLRLILLNSLPLDSPILHTDIQDASYALLNSTLKSKLLSPRQSSLLLTHLPLHKPAGICADAPFMTYYPSHHGGGIEEQNHLSETVSDLVLGWIFGLPAGGEEDVKAKQRGMVLTGHDHVGCDVAHYWDHEWKRSDWESWTERETRRRRFEAVREVTVRSMMGEFGGNAGLVSAWFDEESDSWKFDYQTCKLGIQHVWWTVHALDVIVAISGFVLFIAYKRDEFLNAEKAARVQVLMDQGKKDE
ncbi:hypothetical protein L873DRAFT_1732071 [Choiromyces venosus 120613-1]|uniref:Uncharacterized protein n=1 Tax=Choiromyces venosus 120613-1 TaxID=1336337 RepID=A0A3N4K1P4_9PEZI|nr:hypothetical protein L873DRAFT_1732071 [Choiromyces venosus 120613-1]